MDETRVDYSKIGNFFAYLPGGYYRTRLYLKAFDEIFTTAERAEYERTFKTIDEQLESLGLDGEDILHKIKKGRRRSDPETTEYSARIAKEALRDLLPVLEAMASLGYSKTELKT